VAREDVLHRVADHGVVERHDGAARVSEHHLDAFIGEDVEDELCAGCSGGL
jgi:hypothetical protein